MTVLPHGKEEKAMVIAVRLRCRLTSFTETIPVGNNSIESITLGRWA